MRRAIGWGFGVIALAMCAMASAEWQARMTPNDAIDRAGMQRMLSQRILKAYCQLGIGEQYSNPEAQLAQAINLFEANLLQLDSFVQDPEVRAALEKVKTIWPGYKELAVSMASPDGAMLLLDMNHKLLPLTHDVVVKMEKSFGTATGKWVNIAGRQRMLSQRVAMFYLLHLWGVEAPGSRELQAKAVNEFDQGLVTLSAVEGNTAEIKELIHKLDIASKWLQKALSQDGNNLSFLVATTSERMLENADRLTSLYVQLEKQSEPKAQ